METKDIILASLNESWGYLTRALDGLTQEEIAWTPAPHSNSLAFILWHVARAEDSWVNRIIKRGTDIYETEGWWERLGTAPQDAGTGWTEEQLRSWPTPKLEDLRGYARAVHKKTLSLLKSIAPDELLEIRQSSQPNKKASTILAHLITEIALHVGQIDYLRGVHRGMTPGN